jgi:hypothetical protein
MKAITSIERLEELSDAMFAVVWKERTDVALAVMLLTVGSFIEACNDTVPDGTPPDEGHKLLDAAWRSQMRPLLVELIAVLTKPRPRGTRKRRLLSAVPVSKRVH